MTDDIHAYLERHQQKELLRLLTCGSVDDGKSTLIGRLMHDTRAIYEDQLAAIRRDSVRQGTTGGELDLALLTDGLRAEREQGITIDVAYRYFSTDRRKFIIADCPGHEQYTRNMATGASTCQLAIILIDARHGVMPQTRRHSFICSLLGIKHLVVAVNKMDLVGFDEAVFEDIRRAYTDFAAGLQIHDITFIPMSAREGDNVVEAGERMPWYQGPPLLAHLETVHIASDRNLRDLRLPVQLVLRPSHDFRGFAGSIASGVLRVGDEVVVLPSRARSTVKRLVTFDGDLDEAYAPMAVTVVLADEVDVSRGDVIVRPGGEPQQASEVEAMIVWMDERPLVRGRSYLVKHNTRTVPGELEAVLHRVDIATLDRRPADSLAMNEIGRCRLGLHRPIDFDPYTVNQATGGFILIDRATNGTVGAGMLCDRGDRGGIGDSWAAPGVEEGGRDPRSAVAREAREARFGQRAVTLLLTGLPGSGKATLAYALEQRLFAAGRAVTVLHGPAMRRGLARDLGYTADDRSENLRRAAEVARLFNEAGLLCICAFVAPHEAVRARARQVIGDGRVLEVHLSAPLEVCRARDRTGMYARADAGELKAFPGVSAAYEAPARPDLVLPTHELDEAACVDALVELLRSRGALG
ncbi:sulfate adenylyltransferase subunit CysN [Nannocystis bainbridge]|uniref:Sulfate adenylyltransferase subunit 1 n=1 Tax=Nannocystis bainbridge TaxID=2995303 RepID=A0ABT5DQF3_9BACT|nr:sulfate adenylyltransferase subunit CysN [Nannocystis bainbridge]MDC0715889.1 sulfate adenylyltransferase subunit CysN [Nannocystis bainbridge]